MVDVGQKMGIRGLTSHIQRINGTIFLCRKILITVSILGEDGTIARTRGRCDPQGIALKIPDRCKSVMA